MDTKLVTLKNNREPLQIPIPPGFSGDRSNPDSPTLHLSPGVYSLVSLSEIDLINKYLQGLPYPQRLVESTLLIDVQDPLLAMDHDQIDQIERSHSLPLTRFAPSGGTRSVKERAYLLRESGLQGLGSPSLPSRG